MDDYNITMDNLNPSIAYNDSVTNVFSAQSTILGNSQVTPSTGNNIVATLGTITEDVKTNLLASPLLLIGGIGIICLLIL